MHCITQRPAYCYAVVHKQDTLVLDITLSCLMCIANVENVMHTSFTINNEQLNFVNDFKYLGHIINSSQLDDSDIYRERRNIFYRCNMLARRFYSCSVAVKLRLLKSFCLCFYDVALWNNFSAGSLDKFRSA